MLIWSYKKFKNFGEKNWNNPKQECCTATNIHIYKIYAQTYEPYSQNIHTYIYKRKSQQLAAEEALSESGARICSRRRQNQGEAAPAQPPNLTYLLAATALILVCTCVVVVGIIFFFFIWVSVMSDPFCFGALTCTSRIWVAYNLNNCLFVAANCATCSSICKCTKICEST